MASGQTSPFFEHLHTRRIPTLKVDIEEYRHRVTGARHVHIASEDRNNAFLVAFLTVPRDSTGVAHILEHTALCGSRSFPVRDPFFMMIRRSLNTFMNAFTASDWTAYPFATQNRKDFDNLLRVYLDAAFFPLLEELDFAQEGHRLELEIPGDLGSPLVRKGVVYNEMKGAMSPPIAQVGQTLQSHLFPTTTYHWNSGGDPREIPKLTWEALRAFHARHYHPSNAIFMTYGSFPVAEHHEAFERLALAEFDRLELDLRVPDERRYTSPVEVVDRYATDEPETEARTHVVLGWLLDPITDLDRLMRNRLLSGVLLDNSSSPLRHALETTELGTAPSELSGLDDSTREATFTCGLEGSEPERAEKVEALVMGVIEDVADRGVPREQVEAVLHQIELAQREVGGGSFPYGLQLMVRALGPTLHGADPHAMLDLDPVIERLRAEVESPELIRGLAREALAANPHRVRLTMAPSPELARERAAEERAELDAIKASLSEEALREIDRRAARLRQRQEQEDDPEVLPKVGLEDVPPDIPIPEGTTSPVGPVPVTWYTPPTNGLLYVQVVAPLPALEAPEMLDSLPLLCDCLTEVGVGERTYLETQAWQAATTGGVGARTSIASRVEALDRIGSYFVLSGKALARNREPLAEILHETLHRPRFDELERIRELIAQARAHAESQLVDAGHVLAMGAASAPLAPVAALDHRWHGLLGVQHLKRLDRTLREDDGVEAFARRLAELARILARAPRELLVITEEERRSEVEAALARHWAESPPADGARFVPPAPPEAPALQAWLTSTQVSFCARAYRAVPQAHGDAPALRVLGPYLRNGFLHRRIREQGGAYGAGAGYSPESGTFRFFSYRDPRLSGTLADFDAALEWLLGSSQEPRLLEEAVLGVISEIDRPDSPAGEAVKSYYGALYGRTPAERRRFRAAVLGVTLEELRRVASTYLRPEASHTAVLTSEALLDADPELAGRAERIPV